MKNVAIVKTTKVYLAGEEECFDILVPRSGLIWREVSEEEYEALNLYLYKTSFGASDYYYTLITQETEENFDNILSECKKIQEKDKERLKKNEADRLKRAEIEEKRKRKRKLKQLEKLKNELGEK